MYLPDAAVERLLTETARPSARGSQLGVDTLPRGFLQMRGVHKLYADRRCPVAFTTDDPLGLLARCGWCATAYTMPEVGAGLGRPWPVLPPNACHGAVLTAERAPL
ncbi:MAG TPA: hypothetical protein VKM54_06355 [Myxococcota bacterium]|nr:hypothetical protein [Myxococcota bacterium]